MLRRMLSGLLGAVVMLLVVFPVAVSAESRDAQWIVYYASQPCASTPGDSVAYTDSVWTCRIAGKTAARKAVGFDVDDTSSGGTLWVHLIDDPATRYHRILVPASAGQRQRLGYIFDKVHQRSTLKLVGLSIYF